MNKHLLKSLLVALVALIIPNSIWAADPDLTNDYTLVKSVTWGDGVNIAASGPCAHTAYDTGNKKQQSLTILTAPEDAAGWIAMQGWTDGSGKGWWNRADNSLYCVNGGRSAAVFGDDLTTGWLVVFECKSTASSAITLTNANGEPDGTFSYVASEDGQKYFCTITAAENAYVGFCGNKNAQGIKKISVYKPNNAVVPTTYTVKYQDMSGNTLKADATYDAIVGASISLSDADKANITVEGTTYIYDNDDTEGKTVAENGATVVIVKFHAAATFAYTVNEVCGENIARATNATSYETANVKVGYRKYNAVNGQLYTKDATSKEYNYSFKLTQDNQVENISYSVVEGTTNVVFCAEGEDIEGLTPISEGNTTIRSSNSASAYAPADTKITTLAPGKYKIHAVIYDSASKPNSNWTFMAGPVEAATFNCTTVNIAEFNSDEFVIGRETDIIMAKAGGAARGLDAIYIVKTGDVTEEEATAANTAADAAEALAAAKTALQEAITAAEAIETEGKKGVDALTTAIADAKTALNAAEATVESLSNAKTALADAVTAFEAANAPIYIETDLTAQFNSLANTQWTGSSGQVGWAAPKVTTNSGLEVAAWERYNGSCDWTGEIMSSSVTGLTPGTYKIELYGAAAFTFGRGFGSTDFTGDFSKDASDTYHENDAITENTGVTLFAETSEGTVSKEIPIWYATNFNTSGIATATLENVVVGETGTIKIGLSKTSTSTNWHVVQLKGVTAQVDAVELHANELAAAQAALNAEENAIVTGEEKTALETAISENATVAEQTADAYKAAIKALSDATAAFKDAKAAYQTLADAKEEITMIGYDARFPYASDAKKQAAAATLSAEPANAEDATAKAAAIYKAYRQFAESNAMLEGVEGAVNMTNLIVNPAAEEGIAEPWVVESQSSNGSMVIRDNEPWTDGEDNSTHKYFDGYAWDQNAWDATLKQEVTLPAGKYMLTVKSRASEAVNLTLFAGSEETGMPALGASGCLFNRGWNDSSLEFELNEESTIAIGVKGVTEEVHNWMSFSDFRLVQFPASVQPELPEGVIYSWESPEGTPIEMGGTIEHLYGKDNRLNYPNSGYYTICLNGKKANVNDTAVDESKDAASRMVITLDNAVAEGDTIAITGYITKNSSSKSSAWIVFENGATAESAVFGDESNIYTAEGVEATGASNTKDVVVSAEAAGSKTITLTRGQTGTNLFITKLQIKKANDVVTGINFVKTAIEDGSVYNLNGQKVNKAQKGLYIINGKKVVIK